MIIIMGSVGSGKTEQGERLVKKLNCPRVSTSQLLREQPGGKWDSFILSGKLVGDKDVIDVLGPALNEVKAKDHEFILDGAPRSTAQAKWLIEQIKSGKIMLTAVINLKVSDSVVVERLMKRGREDDKEEIILKRLRDYHNITQPVLDYLESAGIRVHGINGEGSANEVEAEVDKILGL